jgi:hypothetical protein
MKNNLKTSNSTTSLPDENHSQKECDFIDTIAETIWQLENIQKVLEAAHKEALIEDADENSYSLMMERAYEKFKELKPLTKKVNCDNGDLYELIDSDFGDMVCNQQIFAMNATNKEKRIKQKLNSVDLLLMSLGDLEVDEEDKATKKSLIEEIN